METDRRKFILGSAVVVAAAALPVRAAITGLDLAAGPDQTVMTLYDVGGKIFAQSVVPPVMNADGVSFWMDMDFTGTVARGTISKNGEELLFHQFEFPRQFIAGDAVVFKAELK